MAVLAEGGYYLQDGFQEIFNFRGHKLQVRGINTVEIVEDVRNKSSMSHVDQFISWDVKGILLWEDPKTNTSPRIVSRYLFPKNQPQFISAIVFIPKMKVFLSSALDMTFKIFDKSFRLLQSIHHEERAILSLEYDGEKGIVICSGASGITVWRFYRNLSMDNAHVIEKLFTFQGCAHWISNMIYEAHSNKIYALVDRSVHVLSFKRRAVTTVLKDIHDSPVTRVCWYARSQFYLTGCSQGLIKCWTSHFRDVKSIQNRGRVASTSEKNEEDDEEVGSTKFALLHTFFSHNKAITGLILHSTSGLAISASMDGFIKVLNLEAFNELFSVDVRVGVSGMKGINYGIHMACLFSQSNGKIRLWKVTSCCNFFGVSAADVEILDCFDNLQLNAVKIPLSTNSSQSTFKDLHFEASRNEDISVMSGRDSDVDDLEERFEEKFKLGVKPQQKELGPSVDLNRFVVSYAAQDLRVYNRNGGLICRVEPTEVVDGIKSYTLSVYQQMLFCLLESGRVKVYCTRSPNSPFIREVQVMKKSDGQYGTVLSIINVMPRAAVTVSSGRRDNQSQHKSLRHEPINSSINELVVMGTNTGTLLLMDTFNNMEVCLVFQAISGPIQSIKFRNSRKELFVMGVDNSTGATMVKIWNLPSFENASETPMMHKITCFDMSPTLSLFGLGCKDGYIRLFQINDEYCCREVEKQGITHESSVVAISFCDELRIYVTSAMDATVKIWDFDKRLVRSIKFNMPPRAVIFHGGVGDVLICQRNYLLTVTMAIWDEGDYLRQTRESSDPWQEDGGDEAIIESFVSPFLDATSATQLPREVSGKEQLGVTDCLNTKHIEGSQFIRMQFPPVYSKPSVSYHIPELESDLENSTASSQLLQESLRIGRKMAGLNLSPRAGAVLVGQFKSDVMQPAPPSQGLRPSYRALRASFQHRDHFINRKLNISGEREEHIAQNMISQDEAEANPRGLRSKFGKLNQKDKSAVGIPDIDETNRTSSAESNAPQQLSGRRRASSVSKDGWKKSLSTLPASIDREVKSDESDKVQADSAMDMLKEAVPPEDWIMESFRRASTINSVVEKTNLSLRSSLRSSSRKVSKATAPDIRVNVGTVISEEVIVEHKNLGRGEMVDSEGDEITVQSYEPLVTHQKKMKSTTMRSSSMKKSFVKGHEN